MSDNTRKTSFSDLALALANDYESIYVIDSEDDSYVEYTAIGGDNELIVKSSGLNFFVDLVHNCKELVWAEDQDRFISTLRKKRVVESLANGKSFTLTYRLRIDGKPQYYSLKTIRKNGADIIIGVRNVDKEMRRELKEKETQKIYSEISTSLASLFEVIYYIDIKTGHYTEYFTSQSFSELGIESNLDDDFFEKTKTDIQKHIHDEDREMLVDSLTKENLLKQLDETDMCSFVYRQVLDGRMQYMNLVAFKQNNDNEHIVIGVRNIDYQMKRQEDGELYSHIAGSLASRYEAIYYIDLDTHEYIQYSTSEEYAKLGLTKRGDDFFEEAPQEIEKFIHPDDVEKVIRVMNKNQLLNILAKEGTFTMSYRQFFGDEPQYVSMLIVRPKNDEKHIVLGVSNIDAQVKREKSIRNQSQTFDEIAMALAKRYEVIYLVDTKTDEYYEYSSSEEYSKLRVGVRGSNFFEESQENMKRDIYPEDYPMMAMAIQKDYILKVLDETDKFTINYRLILGGRPQYVTLFAVKSTGNPDYILVAVANIDSTRKMEIELENALGNDTDIANHDSLTGLNNKRAYAQMEMHLDNKIEAKSGVFFSLLFCDVNGLKEKNDKDGTDAGDEYIQAAGTLIADTFKNSKVYRIGSDEFVVIIENDDYKNRDHLMLRLESMIEENRKKGDVTIAYGISDYKPLIDRRVQDVFERANKNMFENKKYQKQNENSTVEDYKNLIETEEDSHFLTLFQKLVDAMVNADEKDIPTIEKLVIEMSSYFRLTKTEARMYRNPEEEKNNAGETICCYDTGIKGERIVFLRHVTKVMSIATVAAYMSPDEKPLSDVEMSRLQLAMRTTLTYLSNSRLRNLVTRLTYFDDDGFKNLRSYHSFIMREYNALGGKIAFIYNLRHFSLVNRQISNVVGDIVLKNHFNKLTEIIGERGILARLGGDNFVGICENDQLGNVLNYLDEANVIYDSEDGKSVNITSSVGVYRIPENTEINNPGEIMEKLILSLHAAQSGAKERVVFYNGELITSRDNVMKVQQLFPNALRDEEFQVYYQPKVDIRTGEIIGAEALCRWFHKGKMISPADFIPMLEETSEICKLDFYMLDHVCEDIKRWIDAGKKVVRTSVNLSRKHMINVNLLDNIINIIDKHNIPHSCIEVELTETTTDVEFSDLKRVVKGLQQLGIYTSVDDFGVGYSSLNLIRELPWNVVKVDKSFLPVEGDELDKISMIMFKHVIAMTNEMGIECIVEGVETEKQLQILRENECFHAQGYFFDRPLPKYDFEKVLSVGYYEKGIPKE